MKKILVTGGHPSPAIAVIEELLARQKFAIVYIGRKVISSKDSYSFEYQEIFKFGLKFYDFQGGKLQRNLDISFFISLFKIPYGFFQSLSILLKEKPDGILSFGGFIAFPFIFWGKIFNIPILIHEQTTKTGLSNKILSLFANTFCVSWPINLKQIKHKRLILTGNPLRKDILNNLPSSNLPKNLKQDRPLIYITGGGLGSHFINDLISSILPDILKNYTIIHQCGDSKEQDDYTKLSDIKRSLPHSQQSRFFLYKYIEAKSVSWILRNATFLIGRSGANTITECLCAHLPAIFIPLPHAGRAEQQSNTQKHYKFGVAEEITQKLAKSGILLKKIGTMIKNIEKYKNNFHRKTDQLINPQAAFIITDELQRLMLQYNGESKINKTYTV